MRQLKHKFVKLFIIAASLLLSACGQSGPLYLPPQDNAQTVQQSPQSGWYGGVSSGVSDTAM